VADAPAQPGGGKKILGMPHTTGLIVIGLAALVGGYLLISHFAKGGPQQGGSGAGKGGGGRPSYAAGQRAHVRVIRNWQGHRG
jgi:hypothetical protein